MSKINPFLRGAGVLSNGVETEIPRIRAILRVLQCAVVCAGVAVTAAFFAANVNAQEQAPTVVLMNSDSNSIGAEWTVPPPGSAGAVTAYEVRMNYAGCPAGDHNQASFSCWITPNGFARAPSPGKLWQGSGVGFHVSAEVPAFRTTGKGGLTRDAYEIQVRAVHSGTTSAWGPKARVNRHSPPPPVLLEAYVKNGNLHLRWETGEHASWMTTPADPVSGHTFRWLNQNAAAEHGIGWLETAQGHGGRAVGNGLIDVAPSTFDASFPVAPGNRYGVQVGAHYGVNRRGWWSPIVQMYTDRITFRVGTADADDSTNRTAHTHIHPVWAQAAATYEIGPIPHAQDSVEVSFNDNLKNRHKFIIQPDGNQIRDRSTDSYTVEFAGLQFGDTYAPRYDFQLAVGGVDDSTITSRRSFRIHRLDEGDAPPPPVITAAPGEYLDDDGVPQPQIVVEWEPWAFSESNSFTCQETAGEEATPDPVDYDDCNDLSGITEAEFVGNEHGISSVTLRPANLDFGDEYTVLAYAHYNGKTSNFGSGDVTLRAQSADASLSYLGFVTKVFREPLAIEPPFHPERTEYTLRLPQWEQFLETAVTGTTTNWPGFAVPNHAGASVAGSANVAAANNQDMPGVTPLTFTVTAEDGATTKTYTVNVVRYPRIFDVKFHAESGNEIVAEPRFAATAASPTFTYYLPYEISAGTFEYTRADNIASHVHFYAPGGGELSGTAGEPDAGDSTVKHAVQIPLGGGRYTLTAAAAADSNFTATYTLVVARDYAPSSDASLHALRVIEVPSAAEAALTPPFSAEHSLYTLQTDSESAAVEARFHTHRFARLFYAESTASAADGFDIRLDTAPGLNRMFVRVIAENGDTREYTILITRAVAGATLPDVTAITVTTGGAARSLSPGFAKTTFSYSTSVISGTTAATLNATVGDASDVFGDAIGESRSPLPHEFALRPGDNYYRIYAFLSNSVFSSYVVRITVPETISGDSTLHSAVARERTNEIVFAQDGDGKTAGAGFAAAHTEYTAEILSTAQSVFFTVGAHANASVTHDGAAVTTGAPYEIALQPGENTITLSVTAQNGATKTYTFKFTRSTVVTEPHTPQSLQVSSPAAKQLRAVWMPPSADGGDAVRTYFVRWGEVDGGVSWENAAGVDGEAVTPAPADAENTYALSGEFSPGVTYEVQVAAANTVGIGEWASARGAASGFVLHAPPLTLDAGDARITAKWSAPDSGDTTIAKYHLRHRELGANWQPDSAGAEIAVPLGNTYTTAISSLQNATTYEAQLSAENENGRGPWSASARATPRVTVLAAPRDLAGAAGERRISLTWNAPASNAGSAIREFRVRWARVVDSITRAWNDAAGAASAPKADGSGAHVLRNLRPGVTYEVQVAAVNDDGRGNWAALTTAPRAFSLDVNEDGVVTAADGIIIARFLLGVSGASLTQNQAAPTLTAEQRQLIADNLQSGVDSKLLNVDGGDSTPDHDDGFYVARYLMGLRGENLSETESKRDAIDARMQSLMTP